MTRANIRSADGTSLSYLRQGEGPPIVICHGSFAVAEDWLAFAERLAATRTVYLYDRRGRGLSPYIAEDFAIDAEVVDLAAMVALAGSDTAVLGHSFGGGCALSFAESHGFAGPLILYEPRHAVYESVSNGHAAEVDRLASSGDSEGAMACVLAKVVGMPPEVVAAFRQSSLWAKMCVTVGAFAKEVRLLDSLGWQPGDLDAIAGPISLLIGERSHSSPDEIAADAALRAVLPRSNVVRIPDEGHFAYTTSPILLADIVERCLIEGER